MNSLWKDHLHFYSLKSRFCDDDSTEAVYWVLLIYKRYCKIYQNSLSFEALLTIFELLGQEIMKILRDLKIKEEVELPGLKETLKKTEIQWKALQSILLDKMMGYSDLKVD